MNFLKNIFIKKKERITSAYSIPVGTNEIEVYGTNYSKVALRSLYTQTKGGPFFVSLTRPVRYQIEKGWPHLPFINVNIHGSSVTTYGNWLGYIPYRYGSDVNFDRLTQEYARIEATARVEKQGRSYDLMLLTPSVLEIRVGQNTPEQVKVLDVVAGSGKNLIEVDITEETNEKGKNQYKVSYKGYALGYVSVPQSKKIADSIGSGAYTATISLRYHESYNGHYCKMKIVAM